MALKHILLLLTFTTATCLSSHGLHSQRRYRKEIRGNRRLSTELHETFATGIGLSIEPTVYQDDLYGVLGLHLNATKVQLRDAYWAIAFRTHPDRNDTPEALCDFRNASHAYKILGRSEQTRSEYDSRYRTKMYIETMDQLSRDVIAPFAMDVAMPLIDMTVRGIGNFALPFFQDAYEQSSSVFRAAFQNDESLTDADIEATGFEAITRAANAAMRTGLEQRIRRTRDSIGSTSDRLDSISTQLREAIEKESSLLNALEEVKRVDEESISNLKNFTSEAESATEELKRVQLNEQIKQEKFSKSVASITALIESSALLSETRDKEEEEIARLELALQAARDKNRNTLIKQTTLDINISAEKRAVESLQLDLELAMKEKTAFLESYNSIEQDISRLTTECSRAAEEKEQTVSAVERQIFLRTSLERKNNQLDTKKLTLQETLKTLEAEWAIKEYEANAEKNRILQKRKEAEDKITEDKRIAKEIAQIAEMESSIRRREREMMLMEQERNLLINLEEMEREKAREKEILEILKRSEEIAQANSKKNYSSASPPPPPPHQRLNPFSRKEKYDMKKNIQVETAQKIDFFEKKKTSSWVSSRKTEEYVRFDDFYRT